MPAPVIIVASIEAVDKLDNAMRETKNPAWLLFSLALNRRTIIMFAGVLASDLLLLQVLRPSVKQSHRADTLSVGNHGDHCVAVWTAF